MSEVNKIYLLRGNDTPLSVCLRKREGDGDPVPYDLSEAERIRLALVGHGAHVFASGVTVSGEDNNIVSGVIPGRALLKGDYDLEVTFRSGGRDKRIAVEDMFEAVDYLAEDADGETEGEGAGIWVNVTVQPEVIEIAGPTGPRGYTPVLTADEDGTIYADGVLLTEVVKDVTEAVESAERSRAAAESQRVAAESARVSAETARESQAASDHTRAESDHTTAASDHTLAGTDHTTAVSDHARAESDHTTAQTDHANSVTATDAANSAAEHAEEAAATIDDKIAGKANKDGYYPEMSVGSLVGTEVTQVEGITAIAKSTGIAKINEVRGKSLVWNQGINLSSINNFTVGGGTAVINGHDIEYTGDDSSTAKHTIITARNMSTRCNVGDVILAIGYVKFMRYLPAETREYNGVRFSSIPIYAAQQTYVGVTELGVYQKSYHLAKVSGAGDALVRVGYTDEPFDVSVRNLMFFNLTKRFGAGNEPSTVEEFEALYPLPYYDYNEGEIISNKTEKLDVVGFNQWDEEWEEGLISVSNGLDITGSGMRSKNKNACLPNVPYFFKKAASGTSFYLFWYDAIQDYISAGFIGNSSIITSPKNARYFRIRVDGSTTYNHDICINISDPAKNGTYESYKHADLLLNLSTITGKLNGEGDSVVVFPNGLRSAGTAYDYLIVDADGYARRAVKVMESVDMGTQDYMMFSVSQGTMFRFALNNRKKGALRQEVGAICSKYPVVHYTDRTDKTISGVGVYVDIIDNSYSDAATFKSAMSGVELVYELATPLEYVLDTPIYMCIKTEQGGVISQLPENGSEPTTAPMRMDITYALPPEALISGSSLENLLNALKTANKITNYTMTYNPTSGKWEFTIS